MNKSRNLQSWITNMEENYSQWYLDLLQYADLVDDWPTKWCYIIKPYWYSIWENIQNILDNKLKEKWHENCYFPLLIPEDYLNKEKDHVEWFAPECAIVTHWWGKKLEENIVIRPTSETIMYSTFSKWVNSWKDLPLLINQWANVVRWEKRARPFIRTTEFLWQEGHTVHTTEEEAKDHAYTMINVYNDFMKNTLCIPTIKWKKSEKEKFAWAQETYSVEWMMKDWKALQMGTSHFFWQNFSKAFDIKFTDSNWKQEYAYQTSFWVSTRMIWWIIMVHSDNKWLNLPPSIAPIQVVIIPIFNSKNNNDKNEVLEYINNFSNKLNNSLRIKVDDRDNKSFWEKSYEWEKKWVPLRIEVWKRDMKNNSIMIAKRLTWEKITVILDSNIDSEIQTLLKETQNLLLNNATNYLNNNTFEVNNYNDLKKKVKKWFTYAYWCESNICEEKIKNETWATTRNIPFNQELSSWKCICCWESTNTKVIFAKSY